ncbi:universal stress protein [Nocardia carnea]|uniref:Universal stress protein n=1 Tax=Nocardia carnea TaxID=37328 RepID=A0ABW7TMK1_9NOCA|nr:universal stress protein [Nocardia carnea]
MSTHTEPAVVVGIDGSPVSLGALRWAARAAARYSAPLHLVYAVGAPNDFGAGLMAFDNQAMRADGAAICSSAEKLAREVAGDLQISTAVVDPAPATTLIELSRSARMVVAGTHGYGALGRGLLGSVSTASARHAHCPVAIVPEAYAEQGEERAGLPVVVGVDGSARSAEAIEIGFEEASRHGVGLAAVTTWSEFFRYISRAEMQEEARAIQAESLAGYGERYPDVPVTHVVVEERPARRLLREAEGAQLVVVGSHGRGGFAGMTLGSTSQAVLHGISVPLIIARRRL